MDGMNRELTSSGMRRAGFGALVVVALVAAMLVTAPGAGAQMGGSSKSQQQQSPLPQPGTSTTTQQPPQQGQQQQQPAAPPVDPEEEKAYKAFYDTDLQEPDKVIDSGAAFAQKYPSSHYLVQVYARMTHAYYDKQNLAKMYEYGDKTLAINPDEVTVLTLVGWVIPHDAATADFEGRLTKAEGYEKRALTKLSTMEKPAAMTDDQFAKAKAELTSQAHSGLGLVYFREGKPAEAVTELKQAVEGAASPDATDYYVLGLQLEKLNKEADAADAYGKCAAVAGSLQSRCKQGADDARKKAAKP